MDQYMELEDGLLPLEYVAFGETMPSPISSVPDPSLPQNVNPPPSSSYASSGSYSLSSIDGPFSPMSVGGESVSTFVTGSSSQSVRSEESSSTFRTMPSYPCGSMVAQFPRPFPGREFADRVIPQQEYPTMPTTRTIDYADEIRYEGIDFCTVCGKTYQEIVIDATERYVWGAARANETTDERNARRRGFVNGLEAGLLLFRTAGLSQPASCDFMPHAPSPEVSS